MTQNMYHNGMIVESVSEDDRTWAKIAHLSAIIAMFVSASSLSFIGPLIVWALKKDSSQFVRKAAADSFNFNIGMWLMSILGWILTLTLVLAVIGIPLIIASVVLTLWHHIKAFLAVDKGRLHSYPFRFKILS
ncbi:DUF4870 domain-containing protein [Arcanobacterium haemolyticum]|uniref:DUF4870 domain-containing protein n=2 Tax=Arcanobacterium haemolyticum TaxID=28264 RepID=UPI0011108BA3|nr:DUF4870 domain-containing protein [Arcanobacterium haemolyticum]QCX47213.1 DUF4870 domain-containing protein [Arcanobacterium haemolyticum]